MNLTINSIGVVCVIIALFLELASYYKQIAKTFRTRKSSQVSSTAYLLKIVKYGFTLIGLAIYSNWVGFGLEMAALIICCVALYIVAKFKPKGWSLWK
jgi:predicted Kef-type K+ transport protein